MYEMGYSFLSREEFEICRKFRFRGWGTIMLDVDALPTIVS